MTHKEIILKLIGNIHPVGESLADAKSFENLKTLCELVDELVYEIDNVSVRNKDRHENSMKIMGEYAYDFLRETLGIKQLRSEYEMQMR